MANDLKPRSGGERNGFRRPIPYIAAIRGDSSRRGRARLLRARLAELRQGFRRESDHMTALLTDVDEDVRYDQSGPRELYRPQLAVGMHDLSAAATGDAQVVLEG